MRYYRTPDTFLTAYLISIGFPRPRPEEDNTRTIFCFDNSPKLQEFVSEWKYMTKGKYKHAYKWCKQFTNKQL